MTFAQSIDVKKRAIFEQKIMISPANQRCIRKFQQFPTEIIKKIKNHKRQHCQRRRKLENEKNVSKKAAYLRMTDPFLRGFSSVGGVEEGRGEVLHGIV